MVANSRHNHRPFLRCSNKRFNANVLVYKIIGRNATDDAEYAVAVVARVVLETAVLVVKTQSTRIGIDIDR